MRLKIHILDTKLSRGRLKNYVIQSVVAGIVFYVLIRLLHEIGAYAFLAGAASSLFTVFAMPKSVTAQPRNVIGGHYLCFVIGCAFSFLYWSERVQPAWVSAETFHFTAIALGITVSTFVMVLTDTEHPPAAGTTMAAILMKERFSWDLAMAVLIFPVFLSTVRYIFRRQLKDLT